MVIEGPTTTHHRLQKRSFGPIYRSLYKYFTCSLVERRVWRVLECLVILLWLTFRSPCTHSTCSASLDATSSQHTMMWCCPDRPTHAIGGPDSMGASMGAIAPMAKSLWGWCPAGVWFQANFFVTAEWANFCISASGSTVMQVSYAWATLAFCVHFYIKIVQ